MHWKLKSKKAFRGEMPSSIAVELEGVEPSSARGNHTLSTRLFQTLFSSRDKTWTTNRDLIS